MRIPLALIRWGALLLMVGCATSTARTVAEIRALDAESAARLVAEGGMLYDQDTARRSGYDYCRGAAALIDRGDLRLGIREASKALFLGESGGNRCLVANAKRDLATAYLFAGHLDRAREYAQDAITGSPACASNQPNPARAAQKVLGDVFLRQGKVSEAIKQYQPLLSGNDYQARVATISLANALVAAHDFRRASETLAHASAASAGNVQMEALVNRGVAQLALAEGRYSEAANLFEQASTAAAGADAAYHRLWALDGLARARLALGDRAGAVVASRRAIATAEGVRVRFRSEEFRAGFFGEIQHIFDRAIALLMDAGETEAALAVSEQSRARALEDMIRGRVSASAQDQVIAEPAGRVATPSEIRASLPSGVAVVEYHLTEDRGFAWVIRPGGIRAVTIDIKRDVLATQVRLLRSRIATHDPGTDETATALYSVLFGPIALGKDEQLVIVPHGFLHYVPFQALRGPAGYLVEERPISYAPSGSVLHVLLARRPSPPSQVLALGNPDLGDPRLALPGAEREVRYIKARFPGAETYLQNEATKARFVAGSPRSDLVHVGAHADVDEIDPLYSVIYLASTERQPGRLEAHELYSLGLTRAPVVSLSACNTGLGRVARGDEVLGFTRSFLAAGARTLLVTLWPVDDAATARLMERFYDRLATGSSSAIRAAQIELLREPQTKPPFFWAAFNLVGDPR